MQQGPGGRDARNEALRKASVAAAGFANELDYSGRGSGPFRDQNRDVPRTIAKALIEHRLEQTFPLAGAGVNYCFTSKTTESAFTCTGALYLDGKQRRSVSTADGLDIRG